MTVPASPVYAELLGIAHEHGHITPDTVVEVATPEDSILHDRFEWDDGIAGHKFRLSQARTLIRQYRITVDTPDERTVRVRAFTSMPSDDEGGRGYMPTDEVMATPEGRKVAIQQARREVAALRNKYRNLIDFDAVLAESIEPPPEPQPVSQSESESAA